MRGFVDCLVAIWMTTADGSELIAPRNDDHDLEVELFRRIVDAGLIVNQTV